MQIEDKEMRSGEDPEESGDESVEFGPHYLVHYIGWGKRYVMVVQLISLLRSCDCSIHLSSHIIPL